MQRYRKAPSPFEVMTSLSGAPQGTASGPVERHGPVGGDAQPEDTDTGGPMRSWWKRAQQPIVLRVPHGYAVLLALGCLGLLVLAYWVGQSRGYRLGQQQASAQAKDTWSGVEPASPALRNAVSALVIADQTRAPTGSPTPAANPSDQAHDPRRLDQNYFVLAHYPEADAKQLVLFLSQNGVEAAAFQPAGKKHFQVVALKSFAKGALDSKAYQEYEQNLLRLGRLWHSRGLGPNFEGIYPDKYNGESVERIIMKDTP